MKKLLILIIPVLLSLILLIPSGGKTGGSVYISAKDGFYSTVDKGFYELNLPKLNWKYMGDESVKAVFGMYSDGYTNGIMAYIIEEVYMGVDVDFSDENFKNEFIKALNSNFNETEIILFNSENDRLEYISYFFDEGVQTELIYSLMVFSCNKNMIKIWTRADGEHYEFVEMLNYDIISGFVCKVSG